MEQDDDRGYALILDEMRWEWEGFEGGRSGCNCGLDGDGPPCPHGNADIAQKKTEAQWAKEALEDWVYDPDEDNEPPEDFEPDEEEDEEAFEPIDPDAPELDEVQAIEIYEGVLEDSAEDYGEEDDEEEGAGGEMLGLTIVSNEFEGVNWQAPTAVNEAEDEDAEAKEWVFNEASQEWEEK